MSHGSCTPSSPTLQDVHAASSGGAEPRALTIERCTIMKRSGSLVPFCVERIGRALESAFRDTKAITRPEPLPVNVRKIIERITQLVVQAVLERSQPSASLTVEGVQDLVEMKLMEEGFHDVARDYIRYREHHKALREDSPQHLKILRREGHAAVRFNPMKIAAALEATFRDARQIQGPTPEEAIQAVNLLTEKVVASAVQASKDGVVLHIEFIQDEIERQLMDAGYFQEAKSFILYRAERTRRRLQGPQETASHEELAPPQEPTLSGQTFTVKKESGQTYKISEEEIRKILAHACRGLKETSSEAILHESMVNFYEGMKEKEVHQSNILAARVKIEKEPAYSQVAARLLLDVLYRESMGTHAQDPALAEKHAGYFKKYIQHGISIDRISPELADFDLDHLGKAMRLERDDLFGYLGLQTLYDRYFIHDQQRRLETPQIFWMRVSMGLALREGAEKNKRAIEFYDVLSQFLYMSSTPTLFNAGTLHSQLSSCYLSTIMDDLKSIFKVVADDAQLSKYAGGLGNDWTNVRATGAYIKGTNGQSQGIIPFLKVANDTAVAVNQGGKRKGAMCAYLETWHLDIEDYLELRKNTGDERRRTHDMNTANWICDLFMKRVLANGTWTLFSPNDVPDLHHLYGQAFEKRYEEYEALADAGKIQLFKRIEAVQLWRKMLSMLFETGHPWITFKDPSNIRSPQDHAGVIHSSNLCTEIVLNTSEEETAVCNLGSVNLALHTTSEGLLLDKLAKTIETAVRMLDNVIDINYYPIPEARNANLRHRPVGLGIMGFQDALYLQNISYASHEAVQFADASMEAVSYYTLLASSLLAKERGTYSSYKGSKWDRGILPIDSIDLLAKERGMAIEMDKTMRLDWSIVRQSIQQHGMRNSLTMAIAPTATIANITGVTQSIEPTYKHLYVKSNLSGEFTIPNTFLVEELKRLGLWDAEMLDDLKYFDGSISEIERIPDEVKKVFLTAFEIEPEWIIECGSRRQKWLDMAQSLNLYMSEPSGKKLHNMYVLAWMKGLKTTYYLRTLGATQIEKSTVDVNKRGLQPRWMKSKSASSNIVVQRQAPQCSLEEGCESCQ